MDISIENIKRDDLKGILLDLAENQEFLQSNTTRKKIYQRLEAVYSCSNEEHFRHFYSDIFEVLTAIKTSREKGDISILGQNVKILYENYEPSSKEMNIDKELKKLYDHVSLDIARISYADAGDFRLLGENAVKELQEAVSNIKIKVEDSIKLQEKVEKELNSQQREYIAILGIFAAVVLAFTSGIAFSTSVLNNISNVEFYRLIIVALVIGLVLINLLFGLFYYIDRLVNMSFSVGLWPFIISNTIMILIMLGIFYLRNKCIFL